MGILAWIIFGALVGWLASKVMKTDAQQGGMANILVGIAGALIGGFGASLMGGEPVTGFNLYSFIIAMLGAIVLLGIVKAVRKKPAGPTAPTS